LLADPGNDAILVMNVQTAIRRRTWLADKRQEDILDRHVRSLLTETLGARARPLLIFIKTTHSWMIRPYP
jgi:hypothetical protein